MSGSCRNKIAAQIIKAEMLGDHDKKKKLEQELKALEGTDKKDDSCSASNTNSVHSHSRRDWRKPSQSYDRSNRSLSIRNSKVEKFLKTAGPLSKMFDQEKSLTASDEAKLFIKTSSKFSREDMETKYFSSEIDDSQHVINKSKRHKQGHIDCPGESQSSKLSEDGEQCRRCKDETPLHLVIHSMLHVYLALPPAKPFLSSMSNAYISNIEHGYNSFVSSSVGIQSECEKYIDLLRGMWKAKGYRCIIMETYFRDCRPTKPEFTSYGNHFQIHCLPIKEKYYERARMSFKQALQDCEQEWSMNKKLIVTDNRRIQRYLPEGLSYFWVCFDELTNGFAHVIENERRFSRFFGLEVLSGLLNKDFNPMQLATKATYREAFERSRDFKLEFLDYFNAHHDDD